MNFINSFFEKNFEHAQSLFFDVRFFFFGFTLVSSLGFLIIYSFLYGYYFSGNEIFQISNFSIVSNVMPFNLQILTITSIFFICIYYIFSIFISLIIKKKGMKLNAFIIFVFTALILNVSITMFFANEVTFTSMVSFCLIWGFVGLIICYIYVAIKTMEHSFVTIKGFAFHIVVFAFLLFVLNSMGIVGELETLRIISVFSVPSLLIITTIFHFFRGKEWFKLISYLPITLIISVLILLILEKFNLIFISNIITLSILVPLFHFIILKVIKWLPKITKWLQKMSEIKRKFSINTKIDLGMKKGKENKGFVYNVISQCYSMLSNKANNAPKLAIGLILLLAFVLLPRLSLSCGQLIRMINQSYEKPIKITYVNQSGKESNLFGNYYIENNSTLYASNKCWELEIIKPVNYHIKSVNKEDEENKENKEMCKNQNWFDIFVK
ncbi:hypothetical protein V7295_11305 [Bacillus toyonensis]|uniref:hypothetical protein n=1 Tax=Bacillus toyonensis TaxID=155322 RepID=UPI002FFFB0C3